MNTYYLGLIQQLKDAINNDDFERITHKNFEKLFGWSCTAPLLPLAFQKVMSFSHRPSSLMTTAWRCVALSYLVANQPIYLTTAFHQCISRHPSLVSPPYLSMLSEILFPFMVSWNRRLLRCGRLSLLINLFSKFCDFWQNRAKTFCDFWQSSCCRSRC